MLCARPYLLAIFAVISIVISITLAICDDGRGDINAEGRTSSVNVSSRAG